MGALQLQLRTWAGDPVLFCLVIPLVLLPVSFSGQSSYTLGVWTEAVSKSGVLFPLPLFDLNGPVIILMSFRGGRDIGNGLI